MACRRCRATTGTTLLIIRAATSDQDRLCFLAPPWDDRHPDFLALDRLDFQPLLADF